MTRPQFDESFSLFPLSEIIQNTDSNRKVKKLLETFNCTRNTDLQDFLHDKAVTFEKNLRSRTYLYIDNSTQQVAAYLTITISTLFPIEKDPDSESIKMIKPYFEVLDEKA